MNFHIEPNTGPVVRQIERQLRASIVALELQPGARISEKDIADRFGVSRQPVREALIALAKADLVAILPQRGTVVVKISADRMMQARLIREQIEVGVVRKACETPLAPADHAALQGLLTQQSLALDADNIPGFKVADEQFHQLLAEVSGLALAWQVVGDIKSHLDRVCYLTLGTRDGMRPLVAHHQAILDAVAAQDADAAEAAMRHHLTDILRALPDLIAKRAELFE